MASFGEIGLTGELRTVPNVAQRLSEIRRLGFSQCVLPRRCCIGIKPPDGLTLLLADTLSQAIAIALR